MAQVLIITSDNRYQIMADLGPTPAKISDGFGGWQIIARPRKVGLTQFQGRNPFGMQLNLMFDGYDKGQSQENSLRTLTWMAIPPQDDPDPRKVRLFGPALPYPSSGDWVINGFEYGDAVIWDKTGKYRLRQDVTLTLMRHVAPDVLNNVQINPGLSVSKSQLVNVKAGDTLKKLAAQHYGDASLWYIILDANGMRDPTQINKMKKIRIP
jgi:hypothetical protein